MDMNYEWYLKEREKWDKSWEICYIDGQNAFRGGARSKDNPFNEVGVSMRRKKWELGWLDALAERVRDGS